MVDIEIISKAIKERLNDYRLAEREIENQSERLERLLNKMHEIGAQAITDMPKSPSPANDRITDYIIQKDELEREIASLMAEHKEERIHIERIVRQLKKPDQRAVIRDRFIDCYGWDEVVDMLFGDKNDFVDKEESYRRRTTKLYTDAVDSMAQIVIKTNDDFVQIPRK